jgi:putative ATPase
VKSKKPLAAILRPTHIKQFCGQEHLLHAGKPISNVIATKKLHSMLFWGPPGSGKTTLANVMTRHLGAHFVELSAVTSGVKDLREIVKAAAELWDLMQQKTVLFIDEIHRFNKTQQDALLPFVEDGTIFLIGATTENPSFSINNALLSRLTVYQLYALNNTTLGQILSSALEYLQQQSINLQFSKEIKPYFINLADHDARRLLNNLEVLAHISSGKTKITKELLVESLSTACRKFDHHGDVFYEQISALHKSVRNSDPDAALYWLARMLDGGCDPKYIARRGIRMATEDVGNADPRALQIALNAHDTYCKIGSPEGELALAQAIIYLAIAPKSNAVYLAFKAATDDASKSGSLPVPLHLRNATTKLMKTFSYGSGYKYDHDYPNNMALQQKRFFPDGFVAKDYYYPSEQGLESKIKEKLDEIRKLRQAYVNSECGN